jgi:polyhydroxybutyrate depolymerase
MKLLFITLVSCFGFSAFAQQTINASITHDGLQRDYILYVPAVYDGTANVPLLFNFHGYSSNANQQLFYGDFRAIADTANFIIVHPQGTLDNTNTTHFNVGWGGSTVDDVGFTSALIDTLISQYAIDNERVYSTGMSNGGYMSFRLACELSDRIAAVASVTGAMSPTTLNSCSPTHMTPIMQIHGTADGTVPYNGAAWSSSVADILDYWKTYNALNPAPFIESMPDIDGTDGSTVEREAYLDNNGCMIVTHFKIANGGHTWPGAPFDIGGTNYDIDASTEVWGFLYSIYPNPAKDIITVEGLDAEAQYVQLITLAGKVLLEVELDATNNTLNLSKIPAGNYLLTIGNTTISLSKLD